MISLFCFIRRVDECTVWKEPSGIHNLIKGLRETPIINEKPENRRANLDCRKPKNTNYRITTLSILRIEIR